MANVTISPNMQLPIPNVGLEIGPDWARQINACLSIIDEHNHTAGEGVQIPPGGFSVSTDLSFGGNSATSLKSVVFTPQVSLATLNSVYVSGVDLYYNDGSGSPPIKITSGGAVNATSSGITSGTASASFVSSVLVVNADSTTPADIQGGSVFIGNNTSGSKFLKLSPPSAMAANYTLVLPSIPGAASFVQIDTSGNITGGLALAGGIGTSNIAAGAITLAKMAANSVDNTQLLTGAVTTTKIDAGAVSRPKLAALGQQRSSSSGSFSSSSTSYVNITNLSVTITTTGRPIMIMLQPDNTGNNGSLRLTDSVLSEQSTATFQLLENGGDASNWEMSTFANASAALMYLPPFWTYMDVRSAGTYTYQLQVKVSTATQTIAVLNSVLIAYEIG